MPGVTGKRGFAGFDGSLGPKVSRVILIICDEEPQENYNSSSGEILPSQFLNV